MLKNSVSQGENFLMQPFSSLPPSSLELRKNTPKARKNIQIKDIEKELDFILSHFQYIVFPRTISTFKSQNSQMMVRSKEETLRKYEESNFIDCRINAFPSLKEGVSWAPDFIFIDLDLADFKSKRALDLALTKTLKNIKERLEGYPTVLSTGAGYHIYQPIKGIEFAKYRDFNEFSDLNLFNEFLRFSKKFLSNGKADQAHSPSLKSCLLRIPGSINSKYNIKVKIIEKWNGFRPSIKLLIGDFLAYLVYNKIERNRELKSNQFRNNNQNNANTIPWIEKLLQTSIEDGRKMTINLILSPYLIVIKKISYEEAYTKIKKWVDECNKKRRLDFNENCLIKNALILSLNKKIPPIKFKTIKERNYKLLIPKNK
jgi:hypothetical protein